MKILYIATSFPEFNKGSTIYTDLAEALHEAGHSITVAVSEQTKNLNQTRMTKERGFDVLRIVTGNYYDVSLIEKGITTLRIPGLMKKGISRYLTDRKFDFILFEAPPVTNASLVNWAKKQYQCPSYLMLKDIFPQNAVDLGLMRKNGLLHIVFKHLERKLYNSATIIGCMSEGNRSYIINHNSWLDKKKIEIFPNTKKIAKDIAQNALGIRQKYSIPTEACIFLFGGNMGKPQFVDLLSQAMIDCKNDKNIFFLFVGRGTERYKLDNCIKSEHILNARVVENLPRNQYEQITREIDVGLIILDPRFTIPNYPSRILSYMEYSKPVIAATDATTDLKSLIEQSKCGVWTWSGDKEKFVEVIRKMSKSPLLNEMGKNGREYLERNFSLKNSVDILEKHFDKEMRK